MPQNMEGLRTLLGLQSRVRTDDPFLARRQSEIASGLDDLVPDADSPEYKYDQMEKGARYGVSLPRADARSADLSKLRQFFGIKQREHEQELEKGVLKGQFDVAGQVAGQQAAMDRLIASQSGQDRRAEAANEARSANLEDRLRSMETTSAARDAAAMERARFNRLTPPAQPEASGWIPALWRTIFGGNKQPQAAAPNALPAEEAGAANASEFDFDPATGKLIPRR